MRKAAGILMVIFGVATIGIYIVNLIELRSLAYYWHPPYQEFIIVIILTAFFITGGLFCLKRKYWPVCFTSSIFLHIFMAMSSFEPLFFPLLQALWWMFLIPVWILPLIFICLRKREWSESQA